MVAPSYLTEAEAGSSRTTAVVPVALCNMAITLSSGLVAAQVVHLNLVARAEAGHLLLQLRGSVHGHTVDLGDDVACFQASQEAALPAVRPCTYTPFRVLSFFSEASLASTSWILRPARRAAPLYTSAGRPPLCWPASWEWQTSSPHNEPVCEAMAELMPIRSPLRFTRAPPELPGFTTASV